MAKIIHFPAKTLIQTGIMDIDEMVAGYRSGLHGEPRPDGAAAQHGWRNAMADRGMLPVTAGQIAIARDYVESKRV